MMMFQYRDELKLFVATASAQAYAGGNVGTRNEEGFMEIVFHEGVWRYVDRYAGFMRSWGSEIVFHRGNPVWMHEYGGEMAKRHEKNKVFADLTFTFLMKALSANKKQDDFRPRGPKKFVFEDWEYICEWEGDITMFNGTEGIISENETIFTHRFFGGLVL